MYHHELTHKDSKKISLNTFLLEVNLADRHLQDKILKNNKIQVKI